MLDLAIDTEDPFEVIPLTDEELCKLADYTVDLVRKQPPWWTGGWAISRAEVAPWLESTEPR